MNSGGRGVDPLILENFKQLSLCEASQELESPAIRMKREREWVDNEDDPDVLPLSKRMNNIHFDGVPGSTNGSQNIGQPSMNGYPAINAARNSMGPVSNGIIPSTSSFINPSVIIPPPNAHHLQDRITQLQYSPDLNRNENPIYYDQNKALFELYKERLLRNNYSAHRS